MSRTVNVGIIGTGGMGARHASNLTYMVAAAEVTAIMDVDSARAGGDCGKVRGRADLR